MDNENSRIITYPSQVEKKHHTVLIVDIDNADIENIGLFCMSSQKNYDIYLYDEIINDLVWLADVSNNVDQTLINFSSNVKITTNQVSMFGKTSEYASPIDYFINFDKN